MKIIIIYLFLILRWNQSDLIILKYLMDLFLRIYESKNLVDNFSKNMMVE